MSTVDHVPPREQTANDAICVYVSMTRMRGIRRGGDFKKMSGTSGKFYEMKGGSRDVTA